MKSDNVCYICLDLLEKQEHEIFSTEGKCGCKGSISFVHKNCLMMDLTYQLYAKKKEYVSCSICKEPYKKKKKTRRFPLFGLYQFPLLYTIFHGCSMYVLFHCVYWAFSLLSYTGYSTDTNTTTSTSVSLLSPPQTSPYTFPQTLLTQPRFFSSFEEHVGRSVYLSQPLWMNIFSSPMNDRRTLNHADFMNLQLLEECMSRPFFHQHHLSICTIYGKCILCWTISCCLHLVFSSLIRYIRKHQVFVLYRQYRQMRQNIQTQEDMEQMDTFFQTHHEYTIVPTLFSLSCYLHFLTFLYFFIFSPLGYIAFIQFCVAVFQVHWEYHQWYDFFQSYYEMESILELLFP